MKLDPCFSPCQNHFKTRSKICPFPLRLGTLLKMINFSLTVSCMNTMHSDSFHHYHLLPSSYPCQSSCPLSKILKFWKCQGKIQADTCSEYLLCPWPWSIWSHRGSASCLLMWPLQRKERGGRLLSCMVVSGNQTAGSTSLPRTPQKGGLHYLLCWVSLSVS